MRRRLGKRSAPEIEAELRRMQRAYEKREKFDWKVYGYLRQELRVIDRIAVANGGERRQDLADFDDWCRRKAEQRAAASGGSHVMGTAFKANPKTYCEVRK